MSIRYAVPDDAREIAEINVEGWQTAYRGIIPDEYLDSMDAKSRVERIKSAISDDPSTYLVFEDENQEVLGFCSFGELRWVEEFGEECDCELYAIYVLSESRGKGVGKALLEATIAEFKGQNKKGMLVNVLEGNTSSVNFYKNLGGVEIGGKPFVLNVIVYPQLTFAFKLSEKK